MLIQILKLKLIGKLVSSTRIEGSDLTATALSVVVAIALLLSLISLYVCVSYMECTLS